MQINNQLRFDTPTNATARAFVQDPELAALPIDLRMSNGDTPIPVPLQKKLLTSNWVQSHLPEFMDDVVFGESNLNFIFDSELYCNLANELGKKNMAGAEEKLLATVTDPLLYQMVDGAYSQGSQQNVIRPEVEKLIETVRNAEKIEILSQTREILPKGTCAQDMVVRFTSPSNFSTLHIDTEENLNHCAPIIPGQTKVDGYIADLSNTTDQNYFAVPEPKTVLRHGELAALYHAMDSVVLPEAAGMAQQVLAVYANGNESALRDL